MKKVAIYIISIFVIVSGLFAQSDFCSDAFMEANKLYQDGNFAEAADLYKSIIETGFTSPTIYYNLGNAYFKANNTAHAILAYERAYFLDPRDEDIQNNLEYARLYTQDKISSIYKGSFIGSLWEVIRMVTYSEVKIVIIVLSAIATLFLIIYLVSVKKRTKKKRIFLRLSILFWILALLAFGLYMVKLNDSWMLDAGIIMSSSVDIKSSPTEEGELLFTLHPGTKVVVKEKYGKFLRVEILDGREGWLPRTTISYIIPRESEE